MPQTPSYRACLPLTPRWLLLRGFFPLILIATTLLWQSPAHARPLQDILACGELRVCFANIHPSVVSAAPDGCREDCNFSGPAYEAAQAFADFIGSGVEVRGLRVDWDEQFFNADGRTVHDAAYTPALLDSGRCDLYPNNLTKTEWRQQKFDIVTMFPNRIVVLTHGERGTQYNSIENLGGKTAVVEKDTSFHTWMQETNKTLFASNPTIILLMPTDQALRAIDQGEADFTVIDADAAFWIIRHQYPSLHMAFSVGSIDEVGWGVRKEDKELREAISTFFEQQRADQGSALNDIWQRYLGMSLTQFTSLLGSMQE